MSLKRLLSLIILPAVLLTIGAGCSSGGSTPAQTEEITLKYWRVFDDQDNFDALIKSYQASHPNVRIEYKKLRPEEYEEELVRAIAEGEGPDIFTVHNTKMGEYKGLLQPMPPSVNISHLVTKGTIRKETSLEARTEPTLSSKAMQSRFVDVVLEDAILSYQPDTDEDPVDRVFGLPLAVDTMALFYNRDLLNAAGIAEPPADWIAFREAVMKITKIDSTGAVTQSGAALGGIGNIDRSADILAVLMMQNGTQMTDDRGRVAFHTVPEGTPREIFPSADAVRFYTDFANPVKDVYTWNESFPDALEAFANGQTAFFLGYNYHTPLLKSAAPKLNYGISKLPQIEGGKKVNYANYWLEGVSKTTKYSDHAWAFLLYASDPENVGTYLSESGKPTAARSLIATQIDDEELGVFAEQLLTAQSWYHGKNAEAMEKAFNDLAEDVLETTDPRQQSEAMEQAARIVSQTY